MYHEVFLKQAEALQATLSRSGGVVERASRVAAARFRGTPPRLDMVASDLCMSTRSLQRALAAEGMTFSGIIEGVRRDLALGLLRQPGTTVTEVAFTLGFSEAASFTRAVRRWTGTTPSAVKAGAYTASAGHLTR